MPPAPRSAPLGLAFRDLRIAVASADATLRGWLVEFLSPAFTAVAGDAADCRVEVIADAERLAAARAAVGNGAAPLTCLVQDRELVRLPAARDGDAVLVRHDEVGIAYRVSGDRREVTLLAAPGADARGALMKVVREIAMSAAWMPRGLILHAAAFAVGDRAVLVAGPKRAGKTSLLLHALRLPGARLLANDRVALALDGAGAVAHGLPTIVTLRPDTVERLLPDAAARRAALRHHFARTVAEAEARPPVDDATPRQLSCSPAQLGRLLGVDLAGARPAAALLLPRVDPTARGIALRPLSAPAAAERLPDVLFAADRAPQVSDVFALPGRCRVPDASGLRARWDAVLERLRVFECRLGPDAYAGDPVAQLLAPVLGTAPPG